MGVQIPPQPLSVGVEGITELEHGSMRGGEFIVIASSEGSDYVNADEDGG